MSRFKYWCENLPSFVRLANISAPASTSKTKELRPVIGLSQFSFWSSSSSIWKELIFSSRSQP
ncbi:unnamed protein product, partial [Nesidiocoris tenuis]